MSKKEKAKPHPSGIPDLPNFLRRENTPEAKARAKQEWLDWRAKEAEKNSKKKVERYRPRIG